MKCSLICLEIVFSLFNISLAQTPLEKSIKLWSETHTLWCGDINFNASVFKKINTDKVEVSIDWVQFFDEDTGTYNEIDTFSFALLNFLNREKTKISNSNLCSMIAVNTCFNLSECYIRRLRKSLIYSNKVFNFTVLNKLTELEFQKYMTVQKQYLIASNYGNTVEIQKSWENKIQKELEELKEFESIRFNIVIDLAGNYRK